MFRLNELLLQGFDPCDLDKNEATKGRVFHPAFCMLTIDIFANGGMIPATSFMGIQNTYDR